MLFGDLLCGEGEGVVESSDKNTHGAFYWHLAIIESEMEYIHKFIWEWNNFF